MREQSKLVSFYIIIAIRPNIRHETDTGYPDFLHLFIVSGSTLVLNISTYLRSVSDPFKLPLFVKRSALG